MPLDRVVRLLKATGCRPRLGTSGWSALCPAHDDSTPSLSVGAGKDGKILLYCHAGCPTDQVVRALGLSMHELWPEGCVTCDSVTAPVRTASRGRQRPFGQDLSYVTRHTERYETGATSTQRQTFASQAQAIQALRTRRGQPWRIWEYHDGSGTLVGSVLRWGAPGKKKEIRPLARTDDGRWTFGAIAAPRPLLGLPRLLANPRKTIYVVEGEPAVDAALQCGLQATTSAGGSKAARKSDWSPCRGRYVVILPDQDPPGSEYAKDVARLCREAGAAAVRILDLRSEWPDLPTGGDLVDVLALEHGDEKAVYDGVRYLEGLE